MGKEKLPDFHNKTDNVINFEERKKKILENRAKEDTKNNQQNRPIDEKRRVPELFNWIINDIEEKTGTDKWKQFKNFAQVKVLKSFEDERDYTEALHLDYAELLSEFASSDKEDWETRPKYYGLIYKRIKNLLDDNN